MACASCADVPKTAELDLKLASRRWKRNWAVVHLWRVRAHQVRRGSMTRLLGPRSRFSGKKASLGQNQTQMAAVDTQPERK
jgi:hypothetical protein